jgi:hypothetical protein
MQDTITVTWGQIIDNETGKKFKDAIIIGTDISEWDWKEYDIHHNPGYTIKFITELLLPTFSRIILSSGFEGKLLLPLEVKNEIIAQGYQLNYLKTDEAVKLYNELVETVGDGILFICHSTC